MIIKTTKRLLALNLVLAVLVTAMPTSTQTQNPIPPRPPQRPSVEVTRQNPSGSGTDEFVGPFASWTNVKTAYGAGGDGIADDTDALQRGLDNLSSGGEIKRSFCLPGCIELPAHLSCITLFT